MKKGIFFGIFLFCSITGIFSQRPDLRFIDPLDNLQLSNKNITCIAQDTLGYIWIGTRGGLNRFDGYSLKDYKFVFGDLHCLIDNEIFKLYNDSRGRLWVGTHRGLCFYVPEYDHFNWVAHINDSSGLDGFEINDIREDSKGNLYVSNVSGIYRFQENTQDFIPVFRLSKGELSSFLFDRDDNIWIGTFKEGGLIHLNVSTEKIREYTHDEKDNNTISSNSPVSIALQHNKLWIATYDGGINCYDLQHGIFKKYPVNTEYELYSRVVYVDNTNKVWAIDVTGLKVYDAENDNFSGYYPLEGDPHSIKGSCAGIFQDFQGNYWTLHSGEGVCLSVFSKGFIYFDNSPSRFWYTTAENISAICEDDEGNLWLGNPANGIEVFEWSNTSIRKFIHDPSHPFTLGAGAIFCIFRDRDNQMWIGTNMGGLQYYDKTTRRFYTYRNIPDDSTSLANNDVRSVTEDENGDLWIAVHGKGIDRFDRKNKIFYHYNKNNSNLSNDYTFQVLRDRKENIWVATVWGLSKLEKGGSVFTNYYQVENDSHTLTDNEITSLYEDHKGQLWIGTTDGLNRYRYENNNFERFTEGFASTFINVILGDPTGNIWLGTTKGITRLNPVTGECKNFNQSDGLISGEIYARAGYINSSNALFFGGNKGVDLVSPDKLKFNENPPRVLITGIRILNKEITEYSEKGILQKNITCTKSIRLKHDLNVITFEFLAVNMINAQRNQYAFKLEGFDKEWINAGNKREVTYTNLDHKRYVFRVIASNNDGYWNNEGASLEVTILPPWYQTLLFRILLVLFVISLYVAFHFIRIRQLRKQKAILEKRVKARTLELREKNKLLEKQAEELNETNTLLEERQQYIEEQSEKLQIQATRLLHANQELKQANSTKDKLFSLIAHDLKDPFNTILGFTDLLAKDYNKINEDQKIKIITMIRVSSGRIHELLENLLKWARTQTGIMQVNKKVFRIHDAVNTIVTVFQHTLHEKQISIQLDIMEDLEIYADEDIISTIIRNLLNNAIKFTPKGGKITIGAQQKRGKVIVSVTDTGIGIPEFMLKTLFSTVNYEIQRGTDGEKGSGLGLKICKEFAEIHGGKISVQSEEGKGSTFRLTIPVRLPPYGQL